MFVYCEQIDLAFAALLGRSFEHLILPNRLLLFAYSLMNEFKSSICDLYQAEGTEIEDHNASLLALLTSIEKIFRLGLKDINSWLGTSLQHPWNVFEKLQKGSRDHNFILPYPLSRAVEQVSWVIY